jgi:O-antigen/teichoic acid export membrane protein
LVDDLLTDPDPSLIGRRASRGVMYLLLRYGGVQVTGLAANIALSRLLTPDAYGIYAITLFVLVIMAFLSDFGFGPALLQKRESVSDTDLGTVFTTQQVVLGVLVIAVFLAAPGLASLYHLGDSGVWYFRAIAVAGLFTSLKTVPTIVLERQLLYGRLTLVDVLEVVLFQVTAVGLALLHHGAWSFVWAVLVSKAAGCVLSYVLSGWRPTFKFARSAFLALWSFAAPFQLTWVTYILRDYMIPILGGLLVSTSEVGYLNWALAIASVPGQMAQIVGRVSFPSFSRLQSDPRLLRNAIETSVRALFLVAVPLELAVFSLAPWLISVVFTARWAPALIPLYLLCIHWTGANLTSPLVAALNAMGKPRTALLLNAGWTASTIALALLFVHQIGYIGIALAYAVTIVGASTVAVLLVKRAAGIHLWPQVRIPIGASLLVALAGSLAVRVLAASLPALLVVGIGMGLAYWALIWIGEGTRLRADIGNLMGTGQPAASK